VTIGRPPGQAVIGHVCDACYTGYLYTTGFFKTVSIIANSSSFSIFFYSILREGPSPRGASSVPPFSISFS
jgi:hypothetical protein